MKSRRRELVEQMERAERRVILIMILVIMATAVAACTATIYWH